MYIIILIHTALNIQQNDTHMTTPLCYFNILNNSQYDHIIMFDKTVDRDSQN